MRTRGGDFERTQLHESQLAGAIETEGRETPVFANNQQRVFHKIALTYQAATKAEEYDVFIRTRPDLHFDLSAAQIAQRLESFYQQYQWQESS